MASLVLECLLFWSIVFCCCWYIEALAFKGATVGTPIRNQKHKAASLAEIVKDDFLGMSRNRKINFSMFLLSDFVFAISWYVLDFVVASFKQPSAPQVDLLVHQTTVLLPYHFCMVAAGVVCFGWTTCFGVSDGNLKVALYNSGAIAAYVSFVCLLLLKWGTQNTVSPEADEFFAELFYFLVGTLSNPFTMLCYECTGSLPFILVTAYNGMVYLYEGPLYTLKLMDRASSLAGADGTMFTFGMMVVTFTLPWLNMGMGSMFIAQRVGMAKDQSLKVLKKIQYVGTGSANTPPVSPVARKSWVKKNPAVEKKNK